MPSADAVRPPAYARNPAQPRWVPGTRRWDRRRDPANALTVPFVGRDAHRVVTSRENERIVQRNYTMNK